MLILQKFVGEYVEFFFFVILRKVEWFHFFSPLGHLYSTECRLSVSENSSPQSFNLFIEWLDLTLKFR